MKRKPFVAALAAVSLMVSPALAQDSEELSDSFPWAAAVVGVGVLAGWILMILDNDDDAGDSDGSPASP